MIILKIVKILGNFAAIIMDKIQQDNERPTATQLDVRKILEVK
jgi:hypothetical protein